jgi:2-polyprenyl-3-methyl-5-hydroxy-6-metoxy-1,4-benzoquinol methylase
VSTLEQIRIEWERNAVSRCEQIDSGADISHDKVLVPSMLKLAGNLQGKVMLDVGSGCGFLTRIAAQSAKSILGIDISRRMVDQARARHDRRNLSFECASLEKMSRKVRRRFDICLSNMSLITMPSLEKSLRCLHSLTKPHGLLVFSIGHPCFWNIYRNDEPFEAFDYWRSHSVKAPFRITLDRKQLPVATTYFHRSLATYLDALNRAKFQLEELIEPKPPKDVPRTYTQAFPLPLFAVVRARRV